MKTEQIKSLTEQIVKTIREDESERAGTAEVAEMMLGLLGDFFINVGRVADALEVIAAAQVGLYGRAKPEDQISRSI